MVRSTVFLGEPLVLEVLEVAALMGEIDEVGEDHAPEADMVDGIRGAGLDVLGVVVVHPSRYRPLYVFQREHRLQVLRQLLHLQPLDLVVEVPQRHCPCPCPCLAFGFLQSQSQIPNPRNSMLVLVLLLLRLLLLRQLDEGLLGVWFTHYIAPYVRPGPNKITQFIFLFLFFSPLFGFLIRKGVFF